jgi:hypothetical protein
MTAAVAIYFVFSRLNPVRNIALSAPPVPTIPVMKPEILPPVIVVLVFAANFRNNYLKFRTKFSPCYCVIFHTSLSIVILFICNKPANLLLHYYYFVNVYTPIDTYKTKIDI